MSKVGEAIGIVALQHPQFTFWCIVALAISTDLLIFVCIISKEIRNWQQWRKARTEKKP